jgi:dihydrofolate reductase
MGKVVASLFASLDGYASDAPDEQMEWVTERFGEEMMRAGLEQVKGTDTLLFGRVTYEIMSSYWPTASEDDPFTEVMNSARKVVFSKALTDEDVTWRNSRLAKRDLADEVAELKRATDGDIGTAGSVELVKSLVRLGLLDRLQLQIFPVVLGSAGGRPIFDGWDQTNLELVGSTVLDSRVVVLDYELGPEASARA